MGKRKNIVMIIALASILALTTGCGITITRNYYSCPGKGINKLNEKKEQISNTTYLLINEKNGYN